MNEKNKCLACDCYDEDFGCTMPSIHKFYACPPCPLELEKVHMEFFMAMVPPTVTAQEHKVTMKNGKPVFYEPAELKNAKSKLLANLSKHRPYISYNSGIRLTVKWIFPTGNKHKNGEWRITKPDTDNLQKLLKDCMTKCGFWEDDALVCSEVVEKFWGDVPGIYIRIEKVL